MYLNIFRVPKWVENRGLDEVYHGNMGEQLRAAIPILSLTQLDSKFKSLLYKQQVKYFVLCVDEDDTISISKNIINIFPISKDIQNIQNQNKNKISSMKDKNESNNVKRNQEDEEDEDEEDEDETGDHIQNYEIFDIQEEDDECEDYTEFSSKIEFD